MLYNWVVEDIALGGIRVRRALEKSIIISLCLYNALRMNSTEDLVFILLICLIFSVLLDLLYDKKLKISIYVLFLIASLYNNLFILFVPLILYNSVVELKTYSLLYLFLLLIKISPLNILISMLSMYLSIKTYEHNNLLEESKITRDELREDTISLKRFNEQLRIDRDKNIQIAILTERNRIARELHDSIGHAISSSILQVEALKIISDNKIEDSLNLLQNTLQNGMNDIRRSIHNLYNESFDLRAKIQGLCDEIHSIDFKLNYRIDNEMDYDLKYDIFSVVREAVTNTVKHSNATEVKIDLLNQVKFYSIIIEDNGTLFDKDIDSLNKGIGLISMNEIANKYNGFLKYSYDNGFRIRLVLMKGDAK